MKLRILSLAVLASLGAGSALAAEHSHGELGAADPDLDRLEMSARAGDAMAASKLAALYLQSGDVRDQAKALEALSPCDAQMHPICRVDLGLAFGRQALRGDLDEGERKQLARQSVFRITHAATMENADAIQLLADLREAGLSTNRFVSAPPAPARETAPVPRRVFATHVPVSKPAQILRAALAAGSMETVLAAVTSTPAPILVASVDTVPESSAAYARASTQDLQRQLDQAMEKLQMARMQLEESNRTITALREEMRAKQAPAAAVVDATALNRKALDAAMTGDYETAIPMFRKAAELNHAGAINNLAAMFVNGTGVARDMQQAVSLFERSALLGNAEAAENAARIYNYGIGSGKNPSRARTWYRKAIQLGSARAAQELSDMERAIEAGQYF